MCQLIFMKICMSNWKYLKNEWWPDELREGTDKTCCCCCPETERVGPDELREGTDKVGGDVKLVVGVVLLTGDELVKELLRRLFIIGGVMSSLVKFTSAAKLFNSSSKSCCSLNICYVLGKDGKKTY